MTEPELGSSPGPSVLVVDDEASIRLSLRDALSDAGATVSTAETGDAALSILEAQAFDLVITDIRMPGMSGIELMALVHQKRPETKVVLITAHDHIGQALTAIKMGALEYIAKPFTPAQIVLLLRDNFSLKNRPRPLRRLIGNCPLWLGIVELADTLALTEHNLMIVGEAGTGRRLLAEAIHRRSRRKDSALIKIFCSALPSGLTGSDLVGRVHSRLEAASGGTLVLEEVEGLRAGMQAEFSQALAASDVADDAGTTQGGARILATSSMDLGDMVEAGRFRRDLYQRIAPAQINLPPLRERRDDLPDLVEHFLKQHRRSAERATATFSEAALDAMLRYPYPGNVSELEHIIESACSLRGADQPIDFELLPATVRAYSAGQANPD